MRWVISLLSVKDIVYTWSCVYGSRSNIFLYDFLLCSLFLFVYLLLALEATDGLLLEIVQHLLRHARPGGADLDVVAARLKEHEQLSHLKLAGCSLASCLAWQVLEGSSGS